MPSRVAFRVAAILGSAVALILLCVLLGRRVWLPSAPGPADTRTQSESRNERDHLPDFLRGLRGGEKVDVEIADGMKMTCCWIPPGESQLGSPAEERELVKSHNPLTKEALPTEGEVLRGKHRSRGFWLGKYVVTQEQWQALMGNNPSSLQVTPELIKKRGITDTSRFPVEDVAWDDPNDKQRSVQEFLKKMNAAAKVPASADEEGRGVRGGGAAPVGPVRHARQRLAVVREYL
jgi:hypothetical protein